MIPKCAWFPRTSVNHNRLDHTHQAAIRADRPWRGQGARPKIGEATTALRSFRLAPNPRTASRRRRRGACDSGRRRDARYHASFERKRPGTRRGARYFVGPGVLKQGIWRAALDGFQRGSLAGLEKPVLGRWAFRSGTSLDRLARNSIPVLSCGLRWRPFIQRCSGVARASRRNLVLWRWSRRQICLSRMSSYWRRPRHDVAAATAVGRLPAGYYSPGAKCPRSPLPISWRLTDSGQDNIHR
jgi:hypothetical protein